LTPKIRGALLPEKLGAKNMQNFGRLYTTSDFDPNISETAQDIQNWKANVSKSIPPAFNEKDPVTLVH